MSCCRPARATFPDGTLPEPVHVARIAANLFAAGNETTVQLLGISLARIAETRRCRTSCGPTRHWSPASSRRRCGSRPRSGDRSGSPRVGLSAGQHGPPGDRRWDVLPSYKFRGHQHLHLTVTERGNG